MCRADAIEVAAEDALCGKGYELTMFLFTDIIVVAKVSNSDPAQCAVHITSVMTSLLQRKAAKTMGMMRSPSTASLAAGGQPAMLTHKVGRDNLITLHVFECSHPSLV